MSYMSDRCTLLPLSRYVCRAIACLSLTACTFDLDDPTGIKQHRAEARSSACQQVYSLVNRHAEDSLAAYEQNASADGTQTEASLLAEAKVARRSADRLLAVELEDAGLQATRSRLVARLQNTSEAMQELALLAEDDPTGAGLRLASFTAEPQ